MVGFLSVLAALTPGLVDAPHSDSSQRNRSRIIVIDRPCFGRSDPTWKIPYCVLQGLLGVDALDAGTSYQASSSAPIHADGDDGASPREAPATRSDGPKDGRLAEAEVR
jgi:hypothetical protein